MRRLLNGSTIPNVRYARPSNWGEKLAKELAQYPLLIKIRIINAFKRTRNIQTKRDALTFVADNAGRSIAVRLNAFKYTNIRDKNVLKSTLVRSFLEAS